MGNFGAIAKELQRRNCIIETALLEDTLDSRVQEVPSPLATSRTSLLEWYLSLLHPQSFSLHRYAVLAYCFKKKKKE